MNYVTDTHAFVFYATGKTKNLGRRANRAFSQAEKRQATVYIPTVSFFELSLLLETGKIRTNMSFAEWKMRVDQTGLFVVEPLTWLDVEEAHSLQVLADPFDRLISATASRLNCALITRDSQIVNSRLVETVW